MTSRQENEKIEDSTTDHLPGATMPAGPALQAFIFEILQTAALMFVIPNISTGASAKGLTPGLAVGDVVALEALFAGPISYTLMNPARSLGPALIG